jgi:hypothetical protein
MLDELLFTENLIVVQKDAIIDSSKRKQFASVAQSVYWVSLEG